MQEITNQSFCIALEALEPAAIAILSKIHPGALPISIEYVLYEKQSPVTGSKGSCIIWWAESSNKENK